MRSSLFLASSLAAFLALPSATASAQSLMDALALAYSNSPDLNAQRSTGRATDENVGIAKSLLRPKISGIGTYAIQDSSATLGVDANGTNNAHPKNIVTKTDNTHPATVGIQLTQPIFTGFQASAKIKAAESAVQAQQELIRDTEQTVLVYAATAYMDVVMNAAIVALDEQNLQFLSEQVRASKDRLQVGEGTKTDLSQAEASYQSAVATLTQARATLSAAKATFIQYVGVEPKKLSPALPFEKLVPPAMNSAVDISQREHPALRAAIYNIDVAQANVTYAEGALLPQVSLQGSVTHAWEPSGYLRSDQAQVGINVSVPLYQGGGEYAAVRQAKEQLGTARIQVDVARERMRQIVAAEWAYYASSGTTIAAAHGQIAASELALQGTIEQRNVGERTTLDVLNAQSALFTARISLAQAERQRAVALFTLLQAIGRFDADHLRLTATRYNPSEHYNAVKDQWFGLRTPDGR
ncbi:MAG: TolC family outer membrane protein [Ancalomicrobiaceae bacterium]|nr:TolC family outer membrane protein [Ancalomicrobiaceae bacterium]